MSNACIIRVQSSEGTKRIYVTTQETFKSLHEKVADAFGFSPRKKFILYREQNQKSALERTQARLDLRHGDLIYLISEQKEPSLINTSTSATDFLSKLIDLKEDDVDQQLDQIDGRIPRERNAQLCQHGQHGKCLHCIPIEPYDEEYLKNRKPAIKHMSFQGYLRKLQNLVAGDRSKFSALENVTCSIKEKCSTGHAPWPKGICTKCQPGSVTLMRQPYRHVDNIMFENGNIADRFLNYWRFTGNQRIGFLYGRYEVYDGVPLGIRAVIAAIYEPPQETSQDDVQLILSDRHEATVDKLADRLGLRRIGWIFTDLLPNKERMGTGPVMHHRGHADSCFLTAQECIMSGWFQNKHLNTCKYSPDGYFGSKFVTVVVTGDAAGQIHFEGYQVSNQCMALVKSEILLPTYNTSELGYIKETSLEQYVPDVYYKEKDSYNNEVMKIARPLPLEYLIVDIPTGFPTDHSQVQSTFNDTCTVIKIPFAVENRSKTGELQDMDTLTLYLQQFLESRTLRSRSMPYTITDIVADLHLLLYLAENDIVPFSMTELSPLLDSLRTRDLHGVEKWMNDQHWQTLLQLLQIQFPTPPVSTNQPSQLDADDQPSEWTCPQYKELSTSTPVMNVPSSSNGFSNSAAHSQNNVLALSFNQDCTSLAMGTLKSCTLFAITSENKIEDIHDDEIRPYPNVPQLPYEEVHIIERLFSSSLIAVVSSQAPRKLKVCHFKKGTEICSYSFANTIHAVKLNRSRLIVCLEESIYVHNMRDMKVLHTIRDVPSNPDGLCALSTNEDHPYLAYPGSTITGEIQIFDTTSLKPGLVISAHESSLAAMVFDLSGTKIATASNKGTVIRVHDVTNGVRLFDFRRGIQRVATIYSLAFSPDSMFLAASSNTGTVHVFQLINQKEKPAEKASSWMSSFSSMLGDVAAYLPKQASEVLTQTRSFATVHLQSTGTKTIIGMNSSNKALKLFVAGYDGVVGVYEVNTNDGGECRQIGQYLLFQMTSHIQQSTAANARHSSNDGSARIYPPNLLRNERLLTDPTYETATEAANFPQLPSPSPYGDDE